MGGWGGGEGLLMGTGFLLRVMKVFWNEIVVIVAKPCEYTKNQWIIHFKMVNFVLCELHLHLKNALLDIEREKKEYI